jgi:cysteine desulfurase
MTSRIYLDYNATAPMRPEAVQAVSSVMGLPANASSVHTEGRKARSGIERARAQIAALAGCQESQIIFNSGATEGNNTVLQAFRGQRVLVSAIEHPSVMEALEDCEKLPVRPGGVLCLDGLRAALTGPVKPALVSVMLVNNETGVIQPAAEIASIVKESGALFHVDAVQAAGRIPLSMNKTGIDFMTLSAHKIGGLQGVGALITGPCAQAPVMLRGGGQEKRFRAGTENAAGIAGFGAAAQAAQGGLNDYRERLGTYRDALERRMREIMPELVIFGENAVRVANTSLSALPGIPSKTQLIHMDLEGIAVSNGSACSSGKVFAGHVIRAMGASEELAGSALRVSMGWDTTENDVEHFIAAWSKMAQRLKDKIKRSEHA